MQKFTGLLNETAAGELDDLYRYFDDGAASLRDPPKGLDELADKVNMHRRFVGEKEETHAKFAPCKAKYALLEKFEVAVNRGARAIGETPDAWTSFQSALSEAEATLDASKESFREKLIRMVDKLIVDAEEHGAAFAAKSPKNVEDAAAHASLGRGEFRRGGVRQRVAPRAREGSRLRDGNLRRAAPAAQGTRARGARDGTPDETLGFGGGMVGGVRRVVAGQISGFGD